MRVKDPRTLEQMARELRDEWLALYDERQPETTCAFCGETLNSLALAVERRYCSRECGELGKIQPSLRGQELLFATGDHFA